MDGFDAALADAAALVDALDQITAEQDAALDAILVSLDTTKPDSLDTSMAGYAGTAADSANVIADGQALDPAWLLELPISPAIGGVIGAPPTQVSHDLGTHHVGDPPFSFQLGPYSSTKTGIVGMLRPQIANGDRAIFSFELVLTVDTAVRQAGAWFLNVNPVKAGAFVAQINTVSTVTGVQIVTFSLNVIP